MLTAAPGGFHSFPAYTLVSSACLFSFFLSLWSCLCGAHAQRTLPLPTSRLPPCSLCVALAAFAALSTFLLCPHSSPSCLSPFEMISCALSRPSAATPLPLPVVLCRPESFSTCIALPRTVLLRSPLCLKFFPIERVSSVVVVRRSTRPLCFFARDIHIWMM